MKTAARPIAALLLAAHTGHHGLMHVFYHLGLAGLVLISIVDSSFVPLPIPGVTDLLVILYAANHTNVFLLVFIATLGSALGGFFSYVIAHAGGMAFLEKHVSPRYLKPVQRWVENHAILSVALPAILPLPMPLSPCGPIQRQLSPSGASILITSAPMSPSVCVANGPSTTVVRSMTRIPASGPPCILASILAWRRDCA